jgi:hypothetical protein
LNHLLGGRAKFVFDHIPLCPKPNQGLILGDRVLIDTWRSWKAEICKKEERSPQSSIQLGAQKAGLNNRLGMKLNLNLINSGSVAIIKQQELN